MKAYNIRVLGAGIFAALFGLTPPAWGGGTPAGGLPASCQVDKPSGGAIALRGTAAVEALSVLDGTTEVDLTMRLERAGALAFFRRSLEANVFGLSNEDIACLFLEDEVLRLEILAAFGLPADRNLVITSKSITKDELPDEIPPVTGRGSSMADITIWAQ